ncbi:MAG: type VI secretion system baseplate subunit TssE [Acidobacteria bacterium]|nr:type VI secretion system baseplate subunit TssE [Acidobacteriota bacterium]
MTNTPVTLSVLDRLIDEEPEDSRRVQRQRRYEESAERGPLERPMTRRESEDAHRAGVRRDLEWLLNARRIVDEPKLDFSGPDIRRRELDVEPRFQEVEKSLYRYGLPDFTAYGLSSADDADLLVGSVKEALEIFEPRLKDVRVVPLEVTSKGLRRVRFRIEAKLMMDPASERVSFDTLLELSSGQYQIEGKANAG